MGCRLLSDWASDFCGRLACWLFFVYANNSCGRQGAGCFLCVMRVMRQFAVRRQTAPSPVGEGWGEGFLGCLPILVRAETRKSGYGGDTPCSAFEVSVPVRGCPLPSHLTQEGGTGLLRPLKSSLHVL